MVAAPLDLLGRVYEQPPVTVDPDRALAYARATNDDNPAYSSRGVVPPLFGVVPAWSAFLAAVHDLVPPDHLPKLLHAAQDMRFLRPLAPGGRLISAAEVFAVRGTRSGTWITLRLRSRADDGGEATAPVSVEQYATLFVRGLDAGGSGGGASPSHSFPASARTAPVAEVPIAVDVDQPLRYAEASGDSNAIHLDDVVAKSVGLPGVIVHGMCTMAMCGRAVVSSTADHDPSRLRRLAVRFSAPLFPGHDLVTSIFRTEGEPGVFTYAFEAASQGQRVIRDGLAEVDG